MPDRVLAVALFVLLFQPAAGSATEPRACHEPLARPPLAGGSIRLVPGPGIGAGTIEQAIAAWRTCANYGADFPTLIEAGGPREGDRQARAEGAVDLDVEPTGGAEPVTIFVELRPGNSGSKRCGFFRGRTITLYRWARTSDRTIRGCGSLALNLAHEIGHALGLADADDSRRCRKALMADLEPGNLFERAVTAEECRLAGERWWTFAELDRPAPARPGAGGEVLHPAPAKTSDRRAIDLQHEPRL